MRVFTVNSETSAWVLFWRSFLKIITWQNGKISLLLTAVDKSYFSKVPNMSFNGIHENKILAKISGFSVLGVKAKFGFVVQGSYVLTGLFSIALFSSFCLGSSSKIS